MSLVRISSKNLGKLALPDACDRCFWCLSRLDYLQNTSVARVFMNFGGLEPVRPFYAVDAASG